MADPRQLYYNKRGEILVKNLKSRHFDAYYCESKEDALAQAMELIPKGASVAWGGALSADQIGLTESVRNGNYHVIDRSAGKTPEKQKEIVKNWLFSDTVKGAKSSAIVYSLIETAKANSVEPYSYLALVLTDMQYMGKPFSNEELESLMPWSEEMKQSIVRRTKPTSSSDE